MQHGQCEREDHYLRLNLGCGENHRTGYVNVDKYGSPDIIQDLESFPWPWEDNSVCEILLDNVLEHLGETVGTYLEIFKEIYRICISGASIHIRVPHPRHDTFINDPTHIRAVTPESLMLFSKEKNYEWIKKGVPNSPLALYLDVDFHLVSTTVILDPLWQSRLESGKITEVELDQAIIAYNNVVQEIQMVLQAIK